MGKTIFITGASSGLGKATAKLFQSKGWNVIATMRNPALETELTALQNVTLLPLDVTNLEQIQSTVKEATGQHDIDVVFNNAGYGLVGALEAFSDEQVVRQINTNLLGVIRVTQAFVPYFRKKKSGLFITTTSIGGLVTFPLDSIYHATKWALEGWSEGMSYELGLHNIGIKTIAPGGIKTNFAGEPLDVARHPAYEEGLEKLFNLMNPANFEPVEWIADVVYEAATDGKQQLRYVVGAFARQLYERRLEIGSEVAVQEMNKMVFGELVN
ncbi:SDR family oxidoreductase [Mucilaginibacter sp. P25]|uniref:SDR family oxidoreductase n=2 Tax=Mucilaginibacter TaxID=423349 RepID=A0AAE6JFW2_9SPHI|nr:MULTISPECIES: SDR family oxidoreductase [Mucilaginibacter]QEM04781.1 SDR family oxidoreductase [Mucilaginibacter rubeus]QEM17375.1 SDR family oxidoreductase [Mucilaginibacter gossypii]QTE46109.1 SDR family oxidoreductase [Mucilaginibacter rubeus]QTE52707.1 SDR family oxidoreductase [Mucilaginibacter rubeus]QTE57794.1 SDR family oxidoreductase [Mucilaginibacter rubeus]